MVKKRLIYSHGNTDLKSTKLTSYIDWSGEYNSKILGQKYFEQKKISIESEHEQSIIALSKGQRTYTTTLEWSDYNDEQLELITSCSCPAYKNSHEPCKHIWAVICEVEQVQESDFSKALSQNKTKQKILTVVHSESDDYSHLSLTSYHNLLKKEHVYLREQNIVPWKRELNNLQKYIEQANEYNESIDTQKISNARIWYELEPYSGIHLYSNYNFIKITLHETTTLRSGQYGKLKVKSFNATTISNNTFTKDRRYLELLKGHLNIEFSKTSSEITIPTSLGTITLKELIRSRRLFTYSSDYTNGSDITPIEEGFGIFEFSAYINKDAKNWILGGVFKHKEKQIDSQDAHLTTDLSYIVIGNKIYKTDLGRLRTHCEYLIGYGNIVVPLNEKVELKKIIKNTIGLEQTLLDQDFGVEKKELRGIPKIEIVLEEKKEKRILAQLKFRYDKEEHTPLSNKDIYNQSSVDDLFYTKEKAFEKEILNFINNHSQTFEIEHNHHFTFNIRFDSLNDFVNDCNSRDIEVRTQGYKVKHYHSTSNSIKSHSDWFELKGNIVFDRDESLSIPEIIKKKSLDNNFITLGDGTIGIKPKEWLNRMDKLVQLGIKEENALKFNRAQSIILDLLLQEQKVTKDNTFIKTVNDLKSFTGIKQTITSPNFKGTLRDYQETGLNWLNFLYEFKIGGCLADDMGLGKTIQVLAHLQKLKDEHTHLSPHLIVVPKSLVFNWQVEAKKFTPGLKVLVYEGTKREKLAQIFNQYDIILMTYAIMRKDINNLKETEFTYSILDEAQNIKNTTTLVAKAAYLINSKHKLALSGTPIENHIGELFSIFRYLIPSVLPKSYSLGKVKSNESSMKLIMKGLMPFILKRTKDEVLTDLPEKVESILYCPFEKKQEKIYNEMKAFYQKNLSQSISKDSLKKSKIQILEALLRMRQVACHPGLISEDYLNLESSKMTVLLENIQPLIERGEKVLIFSQFTSFLKIISTQFNNKNIKYSYLDGQTKNRQSVVTHFKDDPTQSVFLISLKAGGVGLNLTEASYCFIIDPWWNPAVEAQAVDRIHRIGQKKKVFAYRLITKGSIEEKITMLQQSKKGISSNIQSTDDSLLKKMTIEDLNFLFR